MPKTLLCLFVTRFLEATHTINISLDGGIVALVEQFSLRMLIRMSGITSLVESILIYPKKGYAFIHIKTTSYTVCSWVIPSTSPSDLNLRVTDSWKKR